MKSAGIELLRRQLAGERLVALGERHGARVEPDVDHLGHARRGLAALRAGERHVVDERAVRVLQAHARALLELVERADHRDVVLLAAPDGQRRAPVALARERPVDVVLQPVAEAAVLDVLGMPGDLLVGGQQLVADPRRRDVPGGLGVVQQRRRAAPAVRIGVLVVLGAQQPAALAQVLDEIGVGVLDEAPLVGADALVVGAVQPHRVDDVQAVLLAEAEVVLAEGDRGVHEAGAVVGGDEVAEQDGVAALAVLVGAEVREGRLVAHAVDRGAREAVDDLHARRVAEHASRRAPRRARRAPRACRSSRARRRARDRPRPPRWRRASTASSSRSAARRRPAAGRRPARRGSARRPRGPRRPGSPSATSWLDSAVPQRGQYGTTRWPS